MLSVGDKFKEVDGNGLELVLIDVDGDNSILVEVTNPGKWSEFVRGISHSMIKCEDGEHHQYIFSDVELPWIILDVDTWTLHYYRKE